MSKQPNNIDQDKSIRNNDHSEIPLKSDLEKLESEINADYNLSPQVTSQNFASNANIKAVKSSGSQNPNQLLVINEVDIVVKPKNFGMNSITPSMPILKNSKQEYKPTPRDNNLNSNQNNDGAQNMPIEATLSLNKNTSSRRKSMAGQYNNNLVLAQINKKQYKNKISSFDQHENRQLNTAQEFFEDLQQAPSFFSDQGFVKQDKSSPEIRLFDSQSWCVQDNKLYNLEFKDPSGYSAKKQREYEASRICKDYSDDKVQKVYEQKSAKNKELKEKYEKEYKD